MNLLTVKEDLKNIKYYKKLIINLKLCMALTNLISKQKIGAKMILFRQIKK